MAVVEDVTQTRKPRQPAPVVCYRCRAEITSAQPRFVYELKNGQYPSGTMVKLQFHYDHRPIRDETR